MPGSTFKNISPSGIDRFIGCNMYELANSDADTTALMIKDAYEEGFKVIRFWAFEPTGIEKLKEIFEEAKKYDIKLIPVLADPSGYLQSYKIDNNWYQTGFRKNYISYISGIISSFRGANEVLLWELINEPFTDSFDDIYNFAKESGDTVKSLDPSCLLSIGTIGGIGDKFGGFFSRLDTDNFEKLYSLKVLDAVSIHDYSFNSTVLERLDMLFRLKGNFKNSSAASAFANVINYLPEWIDKFTLSKYNKTFDFPLTLRSLWQKYNRQNIQISKKLNKPIYVGEVGFKKNMGTMRKTILERALSEYFNDGISGVLLWSFESQNRSQDGHDYGFNKTDGFGDTVKKWNEYISVEN